MTEAGISRRVFYKCCLDRSTSFEMMWVPSVVIVSCLLAICLISSHAFKMSMSNGPLPKRPSQISRQGAVQVAQNLLGAGALLTLSPSFANAYGDADALMRQKKEKASGKPAAPKKDKLQVRETDLGIPFLMLKEGKGPFPNAGDFVSFVYTGFLSNGTIFDSNDIKGKKPLTFKVGQKQVIPGLESVIQEMQAGGEASCSIPAKYAYGEKGVCLPEGCLVPKNENLKYVIKIKTVGAGYN